MKKGDTVKLPFGDGIVKGFRQVKGGECVLVLYTSGVLKDREGLVERRYVEPK